MENAVVALSGARVMRSSERETGKVQRTEIGMAVARRRGAGGASLDGLAVTGKSLLFGVVQFHADPGSIMHVIRLISLYRLHWVCTSSFTVPAIVEVILNSKCPMKTDVVQQSSVVSLVLQCQC